jgi:hypothetical protein
MSTSIPNVVDVDREDPVIAPYCGFKNMHPFLNILAYTFFWDLLVGNFVHVQPMDPTIYLMWRGRARSDVRD